MKNKLKRILGVITAISLLLQMWNAHISVKDTVKEGE